MKFTKEEIEKAFPVKAAVRENAFDLLNAFEKAVFARADGAVDDPGTANDLRKARTDLKKFINTLIGEVFDNE